MGRFGVAFGMKSVGGRSVTHFCFPPICFFWVSFHSSPKKEAVTKRRRRRRTRKKKKWFSLCVCVCVCVFTRESLPCMSDWWRGQWAVPFFVWIATALCYWWRWPGGGRGTAPAPQKTSHPPPSIHPPPTNHQPCFLVVCVGWFVCLFVCWFFCVLSRFCFNKTKSIENGNRFLPSCWKMLIKQKSVDIPLATKFPIDESITRRNDENKQTNPWWSFICVCLAN